MDICFASHNLGKLNRYKKLLLKYDVNLLSLSELNITVKIKEPFETSKENSLYKSYSYSKFTPLPILAVDEELSTNFLPKSLQPGVLVRRIGNLSNKDKSDKEIILYWKKLIKKYPHKNQEFYWKFSISLYDSKLNLHQFIDINQISEVSKYISNQWNPGYPMSTFMSPIGTNQIPYWDIEPIIKENIEQQNFKPFLKIFPKWIENIKNPQ